MVSGSVLAAHLRCEFATARRPTSLGMKPRSTASGPTDGVMGVVRLGPTGAELSADSLAAAPLMLLMLSQIAACDPSCSLTFGSGGIRAGSRPISASGAVAIRGFSGLTLALT